MTDTMDTIIHYGTLRKSGRYPWGSGGELLETIAQLSAKGLSEVDVAAGLGMSTTELRSQKTLVKSELKEATRLQITRQKASGMSTSAIAVENNIPESTVRDMLKPMANLKHRIIQKISDALARAVAKYKYIDIGEGTEIFLGVSTTKMKNAILLLRNKGYTIHYLREEQLGTGKKTSIKVLAAPGVEFKEVYDNRGNISVTNHTSPNDGHDFYAPQPIQNVNANRLKVVYGSDGGSDKDGMIELRRGVDDISLGSKRYAQVRIGVNGDHYLKGMATYSDNMPDGVDMVFYTNKEPGDTPLSALKKQKLDDPTSPFGSSVKQKLYTQDGVEKVSAINIVYEEGDWAKWSRNLASQFLSKQPPPIADAQLAMAFDAYSKEFDEINALTNGVVKKHLFGELSNSVDAASIHLKAAALPRQTTSVLIPAPNIKENEIYAPQYNNGDIVVLVRFPHGGVFEIPTLRVNNKNPEMRSILGTDAKDAVGIHPSIAQRLSGADFDGDSVIVIPNKNGTIRTSKALNDLKNFDPISAYPAYPGMKVISPQQKQLKMGDVSNLIMDMTVKGASESEIARAVRHSMVVIDAEKHELNHKQSRIDNGINALKKKYQGGATAGASTLITRASSELRVPHRLDSYHIDRVTGEKIYTETNETYVNKAGVVIPKTTKSTKIQETSSAKELSSGTVIEKVYATHADKLKSLANRARLETIKSHASHYNPLANKTYAKEVTVLDAKLNLAVRNQPLERKAQLVAGTIYRSKLQQRPSMSSADKKKAKGQALAEARVRVGAKKPTIELTPREWEAIQMGAISPTKLARILRNSDMDRVRELATPRTTVGITTAQETRTRALLAAGYTPAEVSNATGISVTQIRNIDNQ
jgi:hypothetical protein